jgi:hypothetical protein
LQQVQVVQEIGHLESGEAVLVFADQLAGASLRSRSTVSSSGESLISRQ